jgi:hypothetical protein
VPPLCLRHGGRRRGGRQGDNGGSEDYLVCGLCHLRPHVYVVGVIVTGGDHARLVTENLVNPRQTLWRTVRTPPCQQPFPLSQMHGMTCEVSSVRHS